MTLTSPSAEEDFLSRVDPELREAYPRQIADIQALFLRDVDAAKAFHRETQARMRHAFAGERIELAAPGLEGDPDVRVSRFAMAPAFDDCAILWLHGGGFWAGSGDHPSAHAFAQVAPVYSVHYRLAPEHAAPAPARDACAVIDWLAQTVRPQAIVVAGESAGGGIAASAALLNRDRAGTAIALQMLLYPALDDRLETASARMAMPPHFGSRAAMQKSWALYLGGAEVTPYAAAARATDLSHLPPAHICVGELDFLRDECVDYAAALSGAGIGTELALYHGAPHGFDHIAPNAAISIKARSACEAALRRAFAAS